jgi:hypothetical protein
MRKAIAIITILIAGILAGPASSAAAAAKPTKPGPVTVVVSGIDTYFVMDVTSDTGKVQLRKGNAVVATTTGSKKEVIHWGIHIPNWRIATCGSQNNWSLTNGNGVSTPLTLRFLCKSVFVESDLTIDSGYGWIEAAGSLQNYDPGLNSWVPSPNRAVHLQEQRTSYNKNLAEGATDAGGQFYTFANHDWGNLMARVTTPATALQAGTSSPWTPMSVQ